MSVMASPRRPDSARPQSALARISTPALMRLHAMPRWLLPAVTAVLMLGGLLASSAILAAAMLSLLLLMLLWLVALSWPLLSWLARLMRLMVLVALAWVIVGRLQGTL